MLEQRPKLLWFGMPPSEAVRTETKNRDMVLYVVPKNESVDFKHARAAVFWAASPYFDSTMASLEEQLVPSIDNGLLVYVVVDSEAQLNEVNRVLRAALPDGEQHGLYKVRTVPAHAPIDPSEIPQRVLMHDPGPGANSSLAIELPADIILSSAERLMLQRAFNDCKSIQLELITGGLSGARTFYARATLAASNAGPIPVPYFAKLHDTSKLRGEMKSFKEYAEHHVAWHLRPNFLAGRCLYGVSQGILVGSFVEGSRSLSEVATQGLAPSHIQSLFSDTLAVLRSHQEITDPTKHRSVVEPLEIFCRHTSIPNERVECARNFGGDISSPATLWRRLLNLPSAAWLRSSMHGDMHANNVRIRKQDAIVIDFAHATKGPLCADLASLEIWLSFETFDPSTFERDGWQQRVEFLYRHSSLVCFSYPQGDPSLEHWLLPCVQKIREIVQDCVASEDEYLRVTAVYLLRTASFKAHGPYAEDENFRRDYAYWLANRLITYLCAKQNAELEAA